MRDFPRSCKFRIFYKLGSHELYPNRPCCVNWCVFRNCAAGCCVCAGSEPSTQRPSVLLFSSQFTESSSGSSTVAATWVQREQDVKAEASGLWTLDYQSVYREICYTTDTNCLLLSFCSYSVVVTGVTSRVYRSLVAPEWVVFLALPLAGRCSTGRCSRYWALSPGSARPLVARSTARSPATATECPHTASAPEPVRVATERRSG